MPPAAQMCADVCRPGSWGGEAPILPLLTRSDAAACSPVRPDKSSDRRPEAPPARISPRFARFGSDNRRSAALRTSRRFGETVATPRAQCSRRWVAQSRGGRSGTMTLVLKLLPCVVFLNAMRAQTGKFNLNVSQLWSRVCSIFIGQRLFELFSAADTCFSTKK